MTGQEAKVFHLSDMPIQVSVTLMVQLIPEISGEKQAIEGKKSGSLDVSAPAHPTAEGRESLGALRLGGAA